jgi:hypothetical protein
MPSVRPVLKYWRRTAAFPSSSLQLVMGEMMMMMMIIIIIIIQGIGHSLHVPIQNLTSELYESMWTFGRTPWTGDQPDARPLPTQDNTTQKNADKHPYPEWDSNPRSQCSSGRRQYVP